MSEKKVRPYTVAEELLSSSIHGLGAVLGVAALCILVVLSAIYANAWAVVSSAIFGTSIIFLYTSSTLYHAIPGERIKKRLKKLDHIAIYYLIAGSYTPFLLVNLRGTVGWTLFGIVWGLAALGTFLKIAVGGAGTKLWSIGLYTVMGWLVIFASKRIYEVLPTVSFVFLVLGGLFYTFGILFYVWKSKKYTHSIWHLFVLGGTIMHFFAILFGCVLL